jgi:hypothetical protein
LREKKADEAARDLAAALADRVAAARKRRTSEEKVESHDAAAERVRVGERESLARGELRVADLARANDWETHVVAQRGALTFAVSRARAEEAKALAEEEEARRQVASRKSEAQVVANNRARWHEGQRQRAEAKEEEAASEAWHPVKS